ncbi:MAG: NYN domain-containing protein [Rhodocyclaceae bacterium]
MAQSADDISMALFCDFENIALGVRDAQYEKFDIKPILERLLLKGSIVVKKAYCDWERYKSFKAAMHEANFELIEIPHVRQSGKNSADIRMVVDALDLCYTKAHVNTFVIISGDSDFSPLVSKLRENAKRVIGVGVKQSTSDLLIANCDEFIYIDDLMRKRQREDRQSRLPADPQKQEELRLKGITKAVDTLEALLEDRSDDEKVWASVLKEAIKRRHPGFNENYHGYRTLGALLEDAHKRGLLEFGRENNSAYVKRRAPGNVPPPAEPETSAPSVPAEESAVPPAPTFEETSAAEPAAPAKRRARGGRKPKAATPVADAAAEPAPVPVPVPEAAPVAEPAAAPAPQKKAARKSRSTRAAPRRKKTEPSGQA